MGNRRVRAGVVGAVVLLALGAALSGCGSSAPTSDTADEGRVAERPGSQPAGPGNEKPGNPQVGAPARTVIHTGVLLVRVDDVVAAADAAIRITEEVNGYVGSDRRRTEEDTSEATVGLRIPAGQFTSTVARLAKLGKERERRITAEDVSNAVVDLDTRIDTMRASVKRTRALLNRAQSINEISGLERELSSREAELAALEARRRDLSNRVEYSTITVTFTTGEPPSPPAAAVGFVPGLKSGWHAFLVSTQVVLMILGALLPFLVVAAVPATALLWLRRARRRTASSYLPPTPPASHLPPTPPVSGPPR